jgi:hypothetical protein
LFSSFELKGGGSVDGVPPFYFSNQNTQGLFLISLSVCLVHSGCAHEWIPDYVPEGYTEIGRTSMEGVMSIDYQDASGNLLFFISAPADNSLSVNNEDVEYWNEVLDGVEYYIFEGAAAGKYNAVICEIEEGQYRLSAEGVLPVDELIKILQSVK